MKMEREVLQEASGLRDFVLQLSQFKIIFELALTSTVGWVIWHMPPPVPLDQQGMHFLATVAAGLILWVLEVFDEYIVALILLVSWRVLDIVPTNTALAGFASGSWFFVLGALGLGAAVSSSGLPYRFAFGILRRLSVSRFRIFTVVLSAAGVLLTPLLPTGKVRATMMVPIAAAVAEVIGFRPRSNGSAALSLCAYIGFAQMSFMFLTGGAQNLAGWSLLPEAARSEFGWGMWTLAALPAGIFTFCFLLVATHWLFPPDAHDQRALSTTGNQGGVRDLGAIRKTEWLSLAVLALALIGWLGKPLHGIGETWVAMMALVVFLMSGTLDNAGLKNNIDWGFLLFFGVATSLGDICSQLKVDRWLMGMAEPILAASSFHPAVFLMVVVLLVYLVNLFLKKAPAVVLLTLALMPWARELGIHPGVLLLTLALAVQGFILPYQDGPYQLAYFSSEKKAFSHHQGNKLLLAKFVSSFLAILISVPYWRFLGLIH
jgi:anion transporter